MQTSDMIMQISPKEAATKTIGVLLFDRFSNHCLANAVEPLRAANTLAGRELYRWHHVSVEGELVVSSSGLPVQPEMTLAAHPGGDLLFVMPSYGCREHSTPPVLQALRAAGQRFGAIAGLDTGAWPMAAAGLLDGRCATIHWDVLADLAEQFPEVEVVEDRYVIDGDRMTCGGVTTTFELALALIQMHHGPDLRLEVAALFMYGERSPLQEFSHVGRRDTLIHAAVAVMRRHIEVPLTIPEVCKELNLSQKALENLFRREMGLTPRAAYGLLRLREARRLVEDTRLSIAEINNRSGYTDASAMTRAFKSAFGYPPSHLRRTFGNQQTRSRQRSVN
ncbi:MAG: GlxA family transcriptional regulator [Pseudomonadota bacterium]